MQRSARASFFSRSLAVVLSLLISPLPQFAQSNNHAGSISALRVSATRNAGPVKAKDPVNWNDLLKTDATGRMRIGLDDGSILSMGTDSELRVVQHNAAAQQSQLQLNFGRLRSQVVKLTRSGSHFEIRTPSAVAGVIGTDFFLDVTPTHTHLVVYDGVVTLTPIIAGVLQENQTVQVRAGQSADVDQNKKEEDQDNNQVVVVATPVGEHDATIAQTAIETATKAKAAAVTGGSHVLRNTLIVLGVAGTAVGLGVGLSRNGSSTDTHQQIPPH